MSHGSAVNDVQRALWLAIQDDRASVAYNVPVAFHLHGDLTEAAVAAAWRATVERHPWLRTTFHDGDPVSCRTHGAERCDLQVLDLGGPDRRAALDALARREAARPFDLTAELPARWWLARLSARHHVLLLVAHHIVFDVRSAEVVAATLLDGLAGGADVGAARLEPEERPAPAAAAERRLERYVARLQGSLPAVRLPFDRPWTAATSAAGGELRPDAGAAIAAASRRLDCSEWQLSLLAWTALLARYGNEAAPVGVAMSTRRPADRDTVGYFVNTLPIPAEVRPGDTARTLLRRLQGDLRLVYGLRDVSLAEVAARVRPWRLGPANALLQTGATFVRLDDRRSRGGVAVEIEHLPVRGAKGLLLLGVRRTPAQPQVRLEYAADLFDRGTVERAGDHLVRLAGAIADTPDAPLTALDVLGPAERRRLVTAGDGGPAVGRWLDSPVRPSGPPPPAGGGEGAPVHLLVAARAAAAPDAVAVGQVDRTLTYGQLARRSAFLARRLREAGVGHGSLVGLCVRRSPEMVAGVLGVLGAGAAYLPLDPEYPPERLTYMLGDSGARVVVAHRPAAASVPASASRVVWLDDLDDGAPAPPPERFHPDQLAYVIYTSGSTGQPKGVMVSHGALANTIAAARAQFHVDAGSTVLQAGSLSFDISALEIFTALTAGARLQLLPPGSEVSGAVLQRTLLDHGVDVVITPPSVLDLLPEGEYPQLGTVVVGGEATPPDAVARWGPGRRLVHGYGPTEATIYATAKDEWAGYDPAGGPPPIGRPIAGVTTRVLDRDGHLVPEGVVGELYLGGAGLAHGYLGRPALTAERFVPDPLAPSPGARLYRTGDLARCLRSGDLEFAGRADAQVKIRGFRIEPGEIEVALRRHPQVRECVVVARDDGAAGPRLVACVVPEGRPATGALREHLLARLPRHMVPAAWVLLDAIPLTPNGKIDRAALPAPRQDIDGGAEAPETPAEELLATLCAGLLGRTAVPLDADLFELGADSIVAGRLASAVRERGWELPLRAVFETPTVRELAARLTREPAAAEASPAGQAGDDDGPVSLAQERLWLLDRLSPGSPEYNVPLAYRLRGDVDDGALEAALTDLAARHDALRSSLPIGPDGRPRLRIAGSARLPLARSDLSAEALPEAAAAELVASEALVPFDLAVGPLARAALYRLGADDHVLALCLHHTVFDGGSAGVLASELSTLYAARRAGEPAPQPPSGPRYAEIAARQRAWLSDERIEDQLAWWRERLAGMAPVLDLPADRPRPPVRSWQGRRVELHVEPEVAAALRRAGRSRRATPFVTLLAAFQALLARCGAGDDVVVGSPVAGRGWPGTEGMIGLFVNMVVLRTNCSGDPTFLELVERVREVTLGAVSHQDVPFERLVEETGAARDLSAHPLFQVAFLLHHFDPEAAIVLEGLSVEPFPVERRTAKFDLTLTLRETESGGLDGELEYGTDILDAPTVERMAAQLETLLAGAAADPSLHLSELPLQPPAARDRLLAAWDRTAEAPPNGTPAVVELVAAHAAGRPDAPAVRWRGRDLAYGRLLELADRLAARLRSLGVGPDVVVPVCCPRSPAMVAGALAAQRAGGAHLLLDPADPGARLAHVLDQAGPALITDEATAHRFAGRPETVLVLDAEGALVDAPEPAALAVPPPHRDSLAYAVFTSGSTGLPKGVAVPHAALANTCAWYRRAYDLGANDVVAHVVGTAFDVAVLDLWGALGAGGALAIPPDEETRHDPRRMLAWMADEGVTVAFVATPMAELLFQEPVPAGLRLRWMLVGGDKLRAPVPGGLPYRVGDNYGPAECAVVSTWCEVAPGGGGHIGIPVDGDRVVVATAAGEPCPVGVPGELLIGGAGVSRGYLHRPDLTAERFVPGVTGGRFYRTGDRCVWRADGRLVFLGRVDAQVKLRGFRVEPGEIEAVLGAHPGVRQAAVVPVERRPGDVSLVAYVVAADGFELIPAEVRRHLAEHVPDFMVPGAIVLLGALPMTPSGKVDRRALPALDTPAAASEAGPRTEMERVLARVWAGVLGRDDVPVAADFFDAGGHSLMLVRLQRALEDELGREIPLAEVFRHRSIESLASHLAGTGPRAADGPRDTAPLVCLKHPEHPLRMVFLNGLGGQIEGNLQLANIPIIDFGCWSAPAPGLREGEAIHETIESLADHYIDLLRRVHPGGPRYLCGYSFGAMVAYEMAIRLERLGEPVAFFANIDSDLPDPELASRIANEHEVVAGVTDAFDTPTVASGEFAPYGTRDQMIEHTVRRLAESGTMWEEFGTTDPAEASRALAVRVASYRAWLRYTPAPYSGPMTLLRSTASEAIRPLDEMRIVRNGSPVLDVHVVPGDHRSIMTPPGVAHLAEALRAALMRSLRRR